MMLADETGQYSRIARDAYKRMLEIQGKISDPNWTRANQPNNEAMKRFKENIVLMEAAAREAYIAVVFSAFAVESLINREAIVNTSSTFFKNYLDKLDVIAKWVLIPNVINLPVSLNPEGQAFEHLKALIKARNKLVHTKSQRLTSVKEIASFAQKYTPFEDAANAMATLDLISDELGSPLGDSLRVVAEE